MIWQLISKDSRVSVDGWNCFKIFLRNDVLWADTTTNKLNHEPRPKSRRPVNHANKAIEALPDWATFSLNLHRLHHTSLRHGFHYGHKTTLHQLKLPLNSPTCHRHAVFSQQWHLMGPTEGTVTQDMLHSSHMFSKSCKPTTGDLQMNTTQTTASLAIKYPKVTGQPNAK